MFFEDIQSFVAVVRCGSFNKAAFNLCVAQSALSKRVKRLETQMGSVLLERHARGVSLTETGQVFLARAERIVDEVASMEAGLASLAEEPSGTVRLALPPRTSGLLGPRVFARKLSELPKVQLEILEGSPSSIHNWFSRGEADIGLAYNDELGPGFQVDPVLTEPLYLFCKRTLLNRIFDGQVPAKLSIQDLCRVPLIIPRRPHILRVMIDRLCALNNLRPNVLFETDGAATTRGMLEMGLGGTVFSVSTWSWVDLTDHGQILAIPFKSPLVCWNLFLVKSKAVDHLLAVNRVRSILVEEIDALLNEKAWPQASRIIMAPAA